MVGPPRTAPRARTPALVLIAAAYAVAVLALTLLPHHSPGAGRVPLRSLLNVVPLVGADRPGFALNVLMTVPLGLLLPLLTRLRSATAATLVGLVVSGAIEASQGLGDVLVGLGRTVDVNDVIANTAGTLVGLLVYRGAAALLGSAPSAPSAAGRTSTARTPAPSSAVPKT